MKQFASFDGTRISYYEWGNDTSAPPVVLHHGFVANANVNWVLPGIVAALTAAGRAVVAIDARGHGTSEKHYDSSRYGEAVMASDLAILFDVVGASEVDLVGYSMGAVVSLISASQHSRVARLVVGGVGAGVVELGGVDSRVVQPGPITEALMTEDPGSLTDSTAAGFRRLADAVGADRRALAAHAAVVHQRQIALAEITSSTLVIAGEDDMLAVRPEVLADAIPDSKLLMVPGDHLTAVREPRFINGIVDFLARTTG